MTPYYGILHHGSGSTIVQVMAWCHQAPSHYLNQCWIIIVSDFGDIHLKISITKICLNITRNKITASFPRGQWMINIQNFSASWFLSILDWRVPTWVRVTSQSGGGNTPGPMSGQIGDTKTKACLQPMNATCAINIATSISQFCLTFKWFHVHGEHRTVYETLTKTLRVTW